MTSHTTMVTAQSSSMTQDMARPVSDHIIIPMSTYMIPEVSSVPPSTTKMEAKKGSSFFLAVSLLTR